MNVEPIRLESGGWIQHINVKFPDGERSLNVAMASREGSARQLSAELQALLVRLAEAKQDEGRRQSKERKRRLRRSHHRTPTHGYQAVREPIVISAHDRAGLSRAAELLWLFALFFTAALLIVAFVISYAIVSIYFGRGRRQ
jgi:hypothetical protein